MNYKSQLALVVGIRKLLEDLNAAVLRTVQLPYWVMSPDVFKENDAHCERIQETCKKYVS